LFQRFIEETGAETIWLPGHNLSDGMAYDYADKHKLVKSSHNFENDIVEAAKNISKRYQSSQSHIEGTEHLALTIFDKMKNIHGMGKRERLMLQIAVILHDCGKYISLIELADCSYHIIKSTEMIGLSELEREIVANVVKYNHSDFPYYEGMRDNLEISEEAYLTIAKLTAILRIANGLDRSHRQKFKNIKAVVKENDLIITTVKL
jgi:exopolyphosphatase/guanosine-5'-triphosphate,3'-diphosphate pyrophosphatase